MINPITHARDADEIDRYKVEPYVVAADVYSAEAHSGRGGWTWYTGSAGWMYRVALEAILGFTKRGDTLRIEPRIPGSWERFSITYRFGSSTYVIDVARSGDGNDGGVSVDGVPAEAGVIHLRDDGASHSVRVTLSPSPSTLAPAAL
jgi:cellobiose phosphorylase